MLFSFVSLQLHLLLYKFLEVEFPARSMTFILKLLSGILLVSLMSTLHASHQLLPCHIF
jgi:hypothetical protein